MAEFGGGGVLGGLAGIVGGIASAVKSFFGITANDLLKFLRFLRDHLLELSRALYSGLKEVAKALARNVIALARALRDGLRRIVLWAAHRIEQLHTFLQQHLGPVLRFLEKLRKRIQAFYDKYVRPVMDVIDFVRQLNALLEVFHIHVLEGLDQVLGAIERKIDGIYSEVLRNINRIDNFLDKVIGLDGLYQRFTLIGSLSRYRGAWLNGFWNGQIDEATIAAKTRAIPPADDPEDPDVSGAELAKFYQKQRSDLDDALPDLLDVFLEAAGGRR